MASIFGTNGNDVRVGTPGSDHIYGGPSGGNPALEIGNDLLSGKAGNDFIYGYGGNDTLNGNGGNDQLFGGLGNDTLNGNAGNDHLFGGLGNDKLLGGAGNDVFVGGRGADAMNGGPGSDTVDYGAEGGFRGVRVNLLGNGSQLGLAHDTAIDSFGYRDQVVNIPNVIGTKFADVIYGGNHANVLTGGAGNDKLAGGLGIDTLIGGAGKDVFVFNTAPSATNYDKITDFNHVADTFQLENAVMTSLGAGAGVHPLNPGFFHAGTAAADADDYVIYDRANGHLSYDPDGSGASAPVLLAVLTNHPLLAANDFTVI